MRRTSSSLLLSSVVQDRNNDKGAFDKESKELQSNIHFTLLDSVGHVRLLI